MGWLMIGKTRNGFGAFLMVLVWTALFFPVRVQAACGSGVVIQSVTLSTNSAALGQSISVTVVYQQTGGWNQVYV
jgi:hypothetical protein